jgi:DNA-binding LacI/PurR family transcriptional regulator
VLAEAKRLGYRPHIAAQALASGRTRIILIVLPDWPLDFCLRRNLEEASLALDEAGYTMVTYTPHPTGQSKPLWEVLEPDVVLSVAGSFSAEHIKSMRAAGVRNMIPDPDGPVSDYTEEGPVLQLRHLYGLGHRRIAFAGSADPRVAELVQLRLERAQQTAAELGLDPLRTDRLELSDEAAGPAIREWKRQGVTAVAAYNDDVAASVAGAALRLGLTLPQDLSVIGHDDAPIASIFQPRLSTIHVDTAGLGRFMAQVALSAADGRKVPDHPPALRAGVVQRASTCDAPES